MDAAQCGFLIGVRPIVEYLATPFWHGISDRFFFSSYLLTFSFPDKFLSTSISIVRLGTLTAIPNKIWSSLKNVLIRFQAGKVLMLLAISSWVAFTLPIGYIHPPVVRYFSSDILRFLLTIHFYLSPAALTFDNNNHPQLSLQLQGLERESLPVTRAKVHARARKSWEEEKVG